MAVEVRMPQLGLTMEEGTIDEWLKKEGDEVKIGEPIVQIQTDKLTSEVESKVDGILLKIVAKEGEDIPVKGLLAYIGEPGEAIHVQEEREEMKNVSNETEGKTIESVPPVQSPTVKEERRIKISPLARKTAKKLGIDFTNVKGSGPGGRIIQRDILQQAKEEKETNVSQVSSGNVQLMDGDTVIELSGMRKTIAERMFRAHSEIPTVTQDIKIDVTKFLEFRNEVNKSRSTKFTINDFIVKAVAKALRKNRTLLVSLDGNKIIQRSRINIGVAVSVEGGLIVPVIKEADKMGLEQLSEELKGLVEKAREGKLQMDEYTGSTFTISNLGMYGITSFTPIINQPNAAILGVNAIQSELDMDEEGNVFKKQVLTISLTYDHRLIDGAEAAIFQRDVKNLLEDPMSIIL